MREAPVPDLCKKFSHGHVDKFKLTDEVYFYLLFFSITNSAQRRLLLCRERFVSYSISPGAHSAIVLLVCVVAQMPSEGGVYVSIFLFWVIIYFDDKAIFFKIVDGINVVSRSGWAHLFLFFDIPSAGGEIIGWMWHSIKSQIFLKLLHSHPLMIIFVCGWDAIGVDFKLILQTHFYDSVSLQWIVSWLPSPTRHPRWTFYWL